MYQLEFKFFLLHSMTLFISIFSKCEMCSFLQKNILLHLHLWKSDGRFFDNWFLVIKRRVHEDRKY